MRLILAAIATTAVLLAAPTSASAWVCRADGLGSSGGGAAGSAARAKFVALRRCERGSLLHLCTISYCRP